MVQQEEVSKSGPGYHSGLPGQLASWEGDSFIQSLLKSSFSWVLKVSTCYVDGFTRQLLSKADT